MIWEEKLMELFDFDGRFNQTLNAWIEENRKKYRRPEDMEDVAAELYETWLSTPADWLGGVAPGEYYRRFDDARALAELLKRHVAEDVPVPDPLTERLAELADEDALLSLVRDSSAPCEARMTAIALLRQLESTAPMVDYIRWQVERKEDDDLLDNALESLRCMGEAVRRPAKIAFTAADDAGKEALLDVLADYPGDADVADFAIRRFEQCPEKRAMYAGYLGKLDDERAMEPLLAAAESPKVSYIDFIEIRNAIERLGGEAPVRDFDDDPTYRAVKRLQTR
jgi:hypothetical protein